MVPIMCIVMINSIIIIVWHQQNTGVQPLRTTLQIFPGDITEGLAMLLHITMLLLLIRNFQLTLEIYIPEILMCHNVHSSLTIFTRKLHGN